MKAEHDTMLHCLGACLCLSNYCVSSSMVLTTWGVGSLVSLDLFTLSLANNYAGCFFLGWTQYFLYI